MENIFIQYFSDKHTRFATDAMKRFVSAVALLPWALLFRISHAPMKLFCISHKVSSYFETAKNGTIEASSNPYTVESRFLEPPGETKIGLRNRELEKSKVASNVAKFLVCIHVTRRPCWWSIQKKFFY